MKFSDINGAAGVVRALAGMVDSGRVPHAIMFEENDGGGAMLVVQAFLQYLYCRERAGGDSCGECPQCAKISKMIHPDVHYVFPVNKGTSVEFVKQWRSLLTANPNFTERDLGEALEIEGKSAIIAVAEAKSILQILSLSALQGGYRTVVVYLPEKMNREAANSLLKIIEEPPLKTQFVFITHSPEDVLPTISSRCQRIRLLPLSVAGAGAADAEDVWSRERAIFADLMGCLISRDLCGALEVGDAMAALPSREACKRFCSFASGQLRRIFLLSQAGLDVLMDNVPDRDLLQTWSRTVKPAFPRKALEAFSRAEGLLGRNVNNKIVFTDLVDRLYWTI